MKKELTIDGNSEAYAGERELFINWMGENYPEINLINSGYGYYEDDELQEQEPYFWEEYCNS